MSYLILLLLLINTSLFYGIILNKKIENTLFFTVFSYIAIEYLFGIFNIINIGFYFILLCNLFLLIYNIYRIKKDHINLKTFITPGLVLFLLSLLYILYTSIGRNVYLGDEFSHWALKVKYMFYNNTANVSNDSILMFDYLSGTSIFNYFCVKLCGTFNESMLYVGQNIILLSMLLPITSLFEKKKKIYNLFIYVTIIIVPTLFFPKLYHMLFVDGVLAICFAYSIYSHYLYEKDKKYNLINYLISLAMLVFIKDSGMLLAIFSYIIINTINILKIKRKNIWKTNKWYILSIIPAIAVNYSWKFALNINTTLDSFNKKNLLGNVIGLFTGKLAQYQKNCIHNFIDKIFNLHLTNTTTFTINFIICFIILIFIGHIIIKNCKKEKKEITTLVIFLLTEVIIYMGLLLVLYLVSFSEYEAAKVASFPRYTTTILMAVNMVFLVLLIKQLYSDKNKLIDYLLIGIVLISITYNYTPLYENLFRKEIKLTKEKRTEYENVEKVKEKLNKKDRVYFISTNNTGGDCLIARYLLTPYKININGDLSSDDYHSWSIGNKYYEEDIWTKEISEDNFRDRLLKDYTHLYIHRQDPQFQELFGGLFIDEISDNTLYKVEKNEEYPILKKVE